MSSYSWTQIAGAAALAGVGLIGIRKFAAGGVCRSEKQLDGKTVLITGANTGIGFETALDLAKRNARVVMGCRDSKRMEAAVSKIREQSGNQNVHGRVLDLADLSQIRAFAKQFLAEEKRLDLLINNAGVMAMPAQQFTKDGLEMQMGTNHFGHFLLTCSLLDLLKRTAQDYSGVRIVNVSSDAHHMAKTINLDNINHDGCYSPWGVYGESKLANVLFTNELARRLEGTGISCFSLHPGVVATELGRNLPVWMQTLMVPFAVFLKTPRQGAQTSLFAALDDETLDGQTGLFLKDCKITKPNPAALDVGLAKKLWEKSETVVGMK